jgi:ATP-binding cassette subfamily B multidrug efflux pump
MMGEVVDWLNAFKAHELWQQKHTDIVWMIGLIAASPLVVLLQSLLKFQVLQGNFPMRLRWNFHRLMLDHSLSFYQDEFAGRVSAKVMQTALAVRDAVMTHVHDGYIYADLFCQLWRWYCSQFDSWLLLHLLPYGLSCLGLPCGILFRVWAKQQNVKPMLVP